MFRAHVGYAMGKLLPGRCLWASFKDRLKPLRFSIHSWYRRVFCFDGFPSLLYFPLVHFPLPLFQRPRYEAQRCIVWCPQWCSSSEKLGLSGGLVNGPEAIEQTMGLCCTSRSKDKINNNTERLLLLLHVFDVQSIRIVSSGERIVTTG